MTPEERELAEKYLALREQLNALAPAYNKVGPKLFMEKVKEEVFDKYPEIEQVEWDQFTPYFNDGDPCKFSVYSDEVKLNGIDEYDNRSKECKIKKKTFNEVAKFIVMFTQDELLTWFGDHSTVIVTRQGFKTEECNHD